MSICLGCDTTLSSGACEVEPDRMHEHWTSHHSNWVYYYFLLVNGNVWLRMTDSTDLHLYWLVSFLGDRHFERILFWIAQTCDCLDDQPRRRIAFQILALVVWFRWFNNILIVSMMSNRRLERHKRAFKKNNYEKVAANHSIRIRGHLYTFLKVFAECERIWKHQINYFQLTHGSIWTLIHIRFILFGRNHNFNSVHRTVNGSFFCCFLINMLICALCKNEKRVEALRILRDCKPFS